MTTELYIENYKLDLTDNVSALLTLSIDDIKDFSTRSTTWSKSITLPGSSNNNKAFGHIFQVGRANPYSASSPNVNFNFNASKSAQCILFQNQMQTFRGVIRLMQINYINGFNGRVEYEVSLFGNLSNLNSILTSRLIEDLDFSSHNHIYDVNNIIQSWDNPGGSGYYYPLIDYGTYSTDKHNWNFHTFRTALYAKEYVDKIFSSSGFRYDSTILNTSRFLKLVVPHSRKIMTTNQSQIFSAKINSSIGYGFPTAINLANPSGVGSFVLWQSINGSGFNSNDPSHVNNTIFTYNGTSTSNVIINLNLQGTFTTNPANLMGSLQLTLYKNTPNIFQGIWTGVAPSINGSPFTITNNAPISISLSPGDTIQYRLAQDFYGSIDNLVVTSASFDVKAASGSISVPIQIGDTVTVNDQIPKNIRQIDFLVGIVKLFNLYLYEDKNDPYLIRITPYIDYYSHDLSNSVDWTSKLDRSKAIKSKPMSEINSKIYQFKFKSDTDYYNDLYRKRYNEGYGDRIFDSQYEFSQQTNSLEIVFSATPLVGYGGEDKVYPTIFKRTGSDIDPKEENTDSNIRLLQTKKVTGVNFWSIVNDSGNILTTLSTYGYAGHLNDPNAPTNDLNFGATKELFFILTIGNISDNQFNIYWSNYMADITDKDSRLVSAFFKLNSIDILNLDFSKYIYVEGIAFKLNQIKDYNATRPDVCEVELLKVISASYSEATPPSSSLDGCFLLWDDNEILDNATSNEFVYGDCQQGGGGPTPPVVFKLDWSIYIAKFGTFQIFINGVLSVSTNGVIFSNGTNQSGNFLINAGDVIRVKETGLFGKSKSIFVSNNIDGVLTNSSSTLATYEYIFTIDANKNYTANGSINN